jgi:hypothetical protein
MSEVLAGAAEGFSEVAEELATVAHELAAGAEEAADTGETGPPERREGGRRRRRRRRSRPALGQPSGDEPEGSAETGPADIAAEWSGPGAFSRDARGVRGEARRMPADEPEPAEAQDETEERTGRPSREGRRRGRRDRTARPDSARPDSVRPDSVRPDSVRPAEFGDRDEALSTAGVDEHGELADEDQADDEGDGRSEQVGFRNIPSWPDTVGLIIAKNMEARAKNPGNQRAGGGPRGRGNRRRGGS